MKARVIVSDTYRFVNQIEKWAESHGYSDPVYVTDSQDLASIADHFGNRCNLAEITGAMAIIENGDYAHVWVTWSSHFYGINTAYQHVRLYLYN